MHIHTAMGFPSTPGPGVVSLCPLMLVLNGPSASPSKALSLQLLQMGAKNDHHPPTIMSSPVPSPIISAMSFTTCFLLPTSKHLLSSISHPFDACAQAQLCQVCLAPKLIRSDGRENQSNATSNLTKISSDNGFDSDSSSNLELNSKVSDKNEPNNNAFDDEGQLPPEHYLSQVENLDITQLQQKWYSNSTQERLNETHMYWNR